MNAPGLAHRDFRIHRFVTSLRRRFPDRQIFGSGRMGLELSPLTETQRHPTPRVLESAEVNSIPPQVSVIIPTFDKWRELKATLQGLQAQTYRSFEIIVVDTGSANCDRKALIDNLFAGCPSPGR